MIEGMSVEVEMHVSNAQCTRIGDSVVTKFGSIDFAARKKFRVKKFDTYLIQTLKFSSLTGV